jgi:starch synthase
MRVALLTREYPPEVYGGAGVHVEYLARELRKLTETTVHCFGAPRTEPGVFVYHSAAELAGANFALKTFSTDLAMVEGVGDVDVVHSHTWYANLGGHLAGIYRNIPHVITAHSLEPLRPWKEEQLGGGYRLSCYAEKTAYEGAAAIIAVSAGMRQDVLTAYPTVDPAKVHVIHNGIDTEEYQPKHEPETVRALGVDPGRPSVIFVGRITRQKGVPHLLRAAREFDPRAQLVLCAGAPDTPELRQEVVDAVAELSKERTVIWIEEMLPKPQLMTLLTQADVFVCPSVYEPMGIVNLEAMACETAVVASAVGGIPEVVADGVTGDLVAFDENDTETFEHAFAAKVNALLADPGRAAAYGKAGRKRAIDHFSWAAVTQRTVDLYASLR